MQLVLKIETELQILAFLWVVIQVTWEIELQMRGLRGLRYISIVII
jgi:hypothetical protein